MWSQKASLNKFKKTEIIPNIFSDHNTMRLEINYKKNKTIKKHKQAEGKQYAPKLTNNGSLKKSKRKSKNTWRQTLIKTRQTCGS